VRITSTSPIIPTPGSGWRESRDARTNYDEALKSLLIAAGAHPKYIQAQLGHASIQVTMDAYGHPLPGTFARLVDALDDATNRNPHATAEPAGAAIASVGR